MRCQQTRAPHDHVMMHHNRVAQQTQNVAQTDPMVTWLHHSRAILAIRHGRQTVLPASLDARNWVLTHASMPATVMPFLSSEMYNMQRHLISDGGIINGSASSVQHRDLASKQHLRTRLNLYQVRR
jgi:hypothetical protein